MTSEANVPDGFRPEDFAHVASLLRQYASGGHEATLRAVLSNNLNVMLAALDRVSNAAPDPCTLFAEQHPVAMSVLAAFYDDEMGDWVFDVIDNPTKQDAGTYTHWRALDTLRPTAPALAASQGQKNDH